VALLLLNLLLQLVWRVAGLASAERMDSTASLAKTKARDVDPMPTTLVTPERLPWRPWRGWRTLLVVRQCTLRRAQRSADAVTADPSATELA
jgi:hypothetical protein